MGKPVLAPSLGFVCESFVLKHHNQGTLRGGGLRFRDREVRAAV